MLGPFATTSRLTPIQQMSLAVLSRAACTSMSTTTTRDRGDRYGPMEWAQWQESSAQTSTNWRLSVCAFGIDKPHYKAAQWSPSCWHRQSAASHRGWTREGRVRESGRSWRCLPRTRQCQQPRRAQHSPPVATVVPQTHHSSSVVQI